jgi:cytochrome c oxidase cbb3-type subunit I/II
VWLSPQSVRPFRSEVERYGPQAKAGEFVYDHPFLWGVKTYWSRFIREGGKYNDSWFVILSPSISPGSIMPGYKWLFDNKPMDVSLTQRKWKPWLH